MGEINVKYLNSDAEGNHGFTSEAVEICLVDSENGLLHVLEENGEETLVLLSSVSSISAQGVEIKYV